MSIADVDNTLPRDDDPTLKETTDTETRFADCKMLVVQSMLKQIRNGTPIYRLQLPIFLLEPRSLLERYSDFCNHLDYILRIPSLTNPLDRFLGVVKFYLSGWYTRPRDIRNPFNPVLGETFRCHYEHGDSTTYYVAEQISHHPPSTAFCIVNDTKGLSLNGYIRPNMKYKGNSLDISLQGKLVGQISNYAEDYEVTFPHIVVKGVLVGALQVTIAGSARLCCPQTGFYAEFDFQQKGLVKGKNNYVVAHIKHPSSKKPLYTIEGRWDSLLTIESNETRDKEIFFDVQSAPLSRGIVPPLDKQEEHESRRVWQEVIKNITANNEEEALKHKVIVEEHQRALDKERKKEGQTWTPRLFQQVEEDYYVHKTQRASANTGRATF